jgi:hypothetical protein
MFNNANIFWLLVHRRDVFKETKQRNKNTTRIIKLNQSVYTKILEIFIAFDGRFNSL